MIAVSIKIDDSRKDWDQIMAALQSDKSSHVDVGIHSISGEELPMIAATHEFGATIQHPGGQPFIIVDPMRLVTAMRGNKRRYFTKGGNLNAAGRAMSKASSLLPDGRMMIFLKKGKRGMGMTKPHTINIPARSFIRSTVDRDRDMITREMERQIGLVLDRRKTVTDALEHMGLLTERQIRTTVRSNVPPPLKFETIRRKGSDKTLIDTGTMVNSIRYIVKDKQNRALRANV